MPFSREDLIRYAPDRPNYQSYYSSGEQQQVNPYSEQTSSALTTTAVTAGIVGSTYWTAKKLGYNLWDPVYAGLRAVEELSPGNIFRTFQLGNFASQFTTEASQSIVKTAEEIQAIEGSLFFEDLLHRTGGKSKAALQHGLQFKGGKLFAGDTLLLENARAMFIQGEAHLPAAYSRSLGFELPNIKPPQGFTLDVPVGKTKHVQSVYFTGGKTPGRAIFNQAAALANEWGFQRVNRLADAPFGMEPFNTGLKGFQELWGKVADNRFTFAVRPGSAFQTFGRMGMKWGAAGIGLYLGYKTLDWGVRNFPLFNPTSFDEGITAGIAKLGIDASLIASSIADMIPGARSYQEAQEELAPGSTSLLKLAAFPLAGAFSGGMLNYFGRLKDTRQHVSSLMKEGMSFSQALPLAHKQWTEVSHNIFQGSTLGKFLKSKNIPFFGEVTRAKGFALAGAALFALPVLPFLPGALLPEKSREELEAVYSGQEEIAIRKNRWWELGLSPFEGGRIDYYRPHWYPRMLQRSYEKSMYGPDEDPNPILQWFKENFTYGMEREHYRDRPYPITGRAFEDVPVIGPVLAATVGRIVKPPMLMHTEEWQAGDSVLRPPGRMGDLPPGAGDLGPGVPVDPGSATQVFGEQAYRATELAGLTGFSFSSIKKQITGSEEFFDQEERLQSANRAFGAERKYWDLNLGGLGGTSEFFRRLVPHRRRQIQEYNPIKNTQASWLPGAGERSPDFKTGDPFTKISEGELRLPGEGFAARFPELQGVDPEDYPDIYKYKILADVAPYTERTKIMGLSLAKQAALGNLSEEEVALYQTTKKQLAARKVSREFAAETAGPTDYTIPGSSQSASVLAEINRNTGFSLESSSA